MYKLSRKHAKLTSLVCWFFRVINEKNTVDTISWYFKNSLSIFLPVEDRNFTNNVIFLPFVFLSMKRFSPWKTHFFGGNSMYKKRLMWKIFVCYCYPKTLIKGLSMCSVDYMFNETFKLNNFAIFGLKGFR